jgi:hypothetical protein
MLKMKIFFPIILFGVISMGANAQNITVVKESHSQICHDVFIVSDTQKVNITNFKPYETIRDYQLSLDNNYLFVWHRPDKQRALKLSTYDVNTFKKIAIIKPGFGGKIHWNSQNQLVHDWGCGTNCHQIQVYDLQLNTILSIGTTGGYKFNDSKDIVVTFTMDGTELELYNLRSIKDYYTNTNTWQTTEGYHIKKYKLKTGFDKYTFDSKYFRFVGDYNFEIEYPAKKFSIEYMESMSKYKTVPSVKEKL